MYVGLRTRGVRLVIDKFLTLIVMLKYAFSETVVKGYWPDDLVRLTDSNLRKYQSAQLRAVYWIKATTTLLKYRNTTVRGERPTLKPNNTLNRQTIKPKQGRRGKKVACKRGHSRAC